MDELIAFMDTLPDESATNRSYADSEVSLNTLINAQILDVLRQIGSGLGGKKLSKDKLLSPKLSREVARERKKRQEILDKHKQIKKMMMGENKNL